MSKHRKTMGIKPNLGVKIRKLEKRVDRMSILIKELREAFLLEWKAEDEQENDGKYRWPYDAEGKLLPNVNVTGSPTSGKEM
jgi:hypothetical protein|tara:strand:- start:1838 stop:2083 length:246 start_codon:yes stop_codon:yes gene_type:complete